LLRKGSILLKAQSRSGEQQRFQNLQSLGNTIEHDPVIPPAKALALIAKGNLCSGCGGCALVAPGKVTMVSQAPGFLRPRQRAALSEDEDQMIADICPGLGQRVAPGARADDVLWEPYTSMHTGYATDDTLRFAASSGGALSAVLVYLLKSGQVDQVIQTGADPDLPIGNVAVLSRTADEVKAAAGSRYAPSAPLDGLGPLLDTDKTFAFVGKPCDVAALRALAEHDPRVDLRIPFMLSFFCAGVPSRTAGEAVLNALGAEPTEVVAFRYRGNGWPGHATATLADGRNLSMSYHDSWGGILSGHVQHRCKICADGTGTAADLVCADAWESDDRGYPVFEEQDGISLIVSRTAKGEAIRRAAEAEGRLRTMPFDVAQLAQIQPGQSGRRRALLARLAGLRCLGVPIPRYRGLHLWSAARQNSLPKNLKNFLGMLRRVLQGRVRT
jgi:coenzyme F420 hydrogenase subunit beta